MKFLKPIENIYHLLVETKNHFYNLQVLRTLKLPVPVLSIGNLSFGGTGKTPCVIFLAEELSKTYKINIVTKSYKASLKEPQKVDLKLEKAAAQFGDEACLIQSKLEQCHVWSGPHKSMTAAMSLSSQPELILLDDGFSHRKLNRNFDLVLIDATVGFDVYLRESISSLKRASAILITKTNLANAAKLAEIKNTVQSRAPQLLQSFFVATVKTELNVEKSAPLYVFCGLARPETFIQDLIQQGFSVTDTKYYPDHFEYPEAEQKKIYAQYLDLQKKYKNIKLVTTEKDLIKITDMNLKSSLCLAQHKMEMESQQKGELLEKIRKSF